MKFEQIYAYFLRLLGINSFYPADLAKGVCISFNLYYYMKIFHDNQNGTIQTEHFFNHLTGVITMDDKKFTYLIRKKYTGNLFEQIFVIEFSPEIRFEIPGIQNDVL